MIDPRGATAQPSLMLCPLGQQFAVAIETAIRMGSSATEFGVASLDSTTDERLWVQFTDGCVNLNDNFPYDCLDLPTPGCSLSFTQRKDGKFILLAYAAGAAVEQLAAAACKYVMQLYGSRVLANDLRLSTYWGVRTSQSFK